MAIEGFNVKSNDWYCQKKISFEGKGTENITSQSGLHLLIKEPAHSSFCVDLNFTLHLNLIIESGIHSPLLLNCHHQIF